MTEEKKTPLQLAVRILIIIGLIILLILLSFGIIKLVPKAFNGLTSLRTSLFSLRTITEKILVSSEPAVYNSEDHGVITWTQTGGLAEGYYTLQYPCDNDGLAIQKIENPETPTYSSIKCGEPYFLGEATTTEVARTLPIRIISDISPETSETIIVSHRKPNSNNTYREGSTLIHIYPKGGENPTPSKPTVISEPKPTPAPSPAYTPPTPSPAPTYNPPAPQYSSPADLTVRITQVGTLDAYNRFIPTSSANSNDRVAVKFQVTNIGGRPSGSWRFTAYLPTNIPSDQIYYSGYQSSIPAGKTSYFTIGFYGAKAGSNEFRVIVDQQNAVSESNEGNNQASILINTYGTSY